MSPSPTFSAAAVAAPHTLAAQSGLNTLAQGGNAIEAMVAMAATIAVVYPHMNGIGGDGFWLIRDPRGKVRAIEACGYAGARATRKFYRDLELETIPARGPHAALTVPGAIGGWMAALELSRAHAGKLPLRALLDDAVGHARNGYAVSKSEARTLPRDGDSLAAQPGFAPTLLIDGKRPAAGAARKLPALAACLDHLAHQGLKDFYRGDIAREMAAELEKIGSPVTREDLRRYEARWREPLSLRLPGRTALNFPPPTQGLASLIILGLFERLGVKQCDGFAHMHGLIESTKRAFAVKDLVCTDFDRLRHDPAEFLTPAWLDGEAAQISMTRAAEFPLPQASGDTIWMGAIDPAGMAVSYIQSVYWEFGSGCVLEKTGVLLQNRGVAFSLDADAVNPLEPGRKPFHTLNPAMTLFDDGRVMPYGTMGGDGQPQTQAQIATRVQFGMGLADAIDAPRFALGRTWGAASSLLALENRFDPTLVRALENAGHELVVQPFDYADTFGHAGGLIRYPKDGRIEAAHDPRADGGALGF